MLSDDSDSSLPDRLNRFFACFKALDSTTGKRIPEKQVFTITTADVQKAMAVCLGTVLMNWQIF